MINEWKEITDPEELFRLKREGWEIEVQIDEGPHWAGWKGLAWMNYMKYRARPCRPKMKKVKYLCYGDDFCLTWRKHEVPMEGAWIRVPSEDKEIEVPDDN